eukprot:tig00000692_g3268.t1
MAGKPEFQIVEEAVGAVPVVNFLYRGVASNLAFRRGDQEEQMRQEALGSRAAWKTIASAISWSIWGREGAIAGAVVAEIADRLGVMEPQGPAQQQ